MWPARCKTAGSLRSPGPTLWARLLVQGDDVQARSLDTDCGEVAEMWRLDPQCESWPRGRSGGLRGAQDRLGTQLAKFAARDRTLSLHRSTK